jgi:excisionase family DNA binding protein
MPRGVFAVVSPVFLTAAEAAERVRVSTSMVYEWVRRRVLPCYRPTVNGRGKVLIKVEDLDALMATFKVEGVDTAPADDDGPLRHIK